MALLLVVSAWLQRQYGSAGALVAIAAVALVEVHAAAASIAQLAVNGSMTWPATMGLVLLLAVSAVAKSVLAFFSGGRPTAFASRWACSPHLLRQRYGCCLQDNHADTWDFPWGIPLSCATCTEEYISDVPR